MLINVISRLKCITKKKKYGKGLKFGNQQNSIDIVISIGVECTLSNLDIVQDTGDLSKIIQHKIQFYDYNITDSHDQSEGDNNNSIANNIDIEVKSIKSNNSFNRIQSQNTDSDNNPNVENNIVVENKKNEYIPSGKSNNEISIIVTWLDKIS